MFKDKVRGMILSNGLLVPNGEVLVAISGGADSVALLRVLLDLGYACAALHCNFRLRGGESGRDEAFVRALCEKLDVRLRVQSFDTRAFAAEKGVSIEMAARDLRYGWFEECLEQTGAQAVAVAHNEDDNVETFLLNLTRGTGLNGLTGMRLRNGSVVRPLLGVSRREITDYLAAIRQDFVTDSTNLLADCKRNKLRLEIIPMLETLNPSFKATISDTIARLKDVAAIYNRRIEACRSELLGGGGLDIDALKAEPGASSLLFELLRPYGFVSGQVEEIFRSADAQSGKRFFSETHVLVKDRTHFLLAPRKQGEEDEETVLTMPSCEIPIGRLEASCERVGRNEASFPRRDDVACLDKSKIRGELRIRRWRRGDRFVPLGMRGRKNVSDFLTDRKKTMLEKEKTYVLTDDRNIVWIIGQRIDDRYKVTKETREAMIIAFYEYNNDAGGLKHVEKD